MGIRIFTITPPCQSAASQLARQDAGRSIRRTWWVDVEVGAEAKSVSYRAERREKRRGQSGSLYGRQLPIPLCTRIGNRFEIKRARDCSRELSRWIDPRWNEGSGCGGAAGGCRRTSRLLVAAESRRSGCSSNVADRHSASWAGGGGIKRGRAEALAAEGGVEDVGRGRGSARMYRGRRQETKEETTLGLRGINHQWQRGEAERSWGCGPSPNGLASLSLARFCSCPPVARHQLPCPTVQITQEGKVPHCTTIPSIPS